jgi:broad specificity phosphatase PhoE
MGADRVVLIRHGESLWNAAGRWQGQGGPGLSVLGHRQAVATAAFLAEREPDVRRIAASDLPRVVETAAPAAAAFGIEPVLDERLREIDVGWWSGLTTPEVLERDPGGVAAMRAGHDPPRGGAERMADVRIRVSRALDELVDVCDGGTLLVFSHGGPVRSVVGHLLGLSVAQQATLAGPGNASRTVLTNGGRRRQLRSYNETTHVADV